MVTSTNHVNVTLIDLLANPDNIGQLLSDFAFTLSSTPTTALHTTTTPTGSLIDIDTHGNVTTHYGSIASWGLTSSGPTIHLDSLAGADSQTIIGPAGPGGKYTNADHSIAGSSSDNPFLKGTVTFNFNVWGVTSDTTVTGASFSFGTDECDRNIVIGSCPNCGWTDPPGGGESGTIEHVLDGRWPPGHRRSWQVPASLSRIRSLRFVKGKLPGGGLPFSFFSRHIPWRKMGAVHHVTG